MTPCDSCYNVFPSTLNLLILVMEVIRSSETSVLKRATLCDIPEGDVLQI
jgi:hypothetical protein